MKKLKYIFIIPALLLLTGASFFQKTGLVTQNTSVTASGGTTTLVATSNQIYLVSGSSTQTIKLPDATQLFGGWWFIVQNKSSGIVTVVDSGDNALASMKQGTWAYFWLTSNAFSTGNWIVQVGTQEDSIDVQALQNLSTDFAPQYLNETRGDNLYYRKNAFAQSYTGFVQNVRTNDLGLIDSSFLAGTTGTGDVIGPSSSTDSAIVLYDGTTGKLIKNSSVTVSGSNISGNASTSSALATTPVQCLTPGEFATGIDANGDANCSAPSGTGTVTSVALSVPATSILGVTGSPVTTSGTLGLTTTGTSGGIPYFSSTSQLASSSALTANQIVLGGGAGVAPSSLGSLGTTSQVLIGNSGGAPSFGQVTDAMISSTASIDRGKIASATANAVVVNAGDGKLTGGVSGSASGQALTWDGTAWGVLQAIDRGVIALATPNSVIVNAGDGKITGGVAPGTSGNVLTSNGTSWTSAAPTGAAGAKNFCTYTSQTSTTSTTIAIDDTIPQQTEGVELLTCSITPTSASSRLRVRVWIPVQNAANNVAIGALFRDSTSDALATGWTTVSATHGIVSFEADVASSSTSSTTFKVRISTQGGTLNINGTGTRYFGGSLYASISIQELL